MEVNAIESPGWVPDATVTAFVPSIPREERRALIAAFEAGKVIEWRNQYGPEFVKEHMGRRVWRQWDYRDLAGENQPELGHAHYADQGIEWRVPEQEQITVKYKIGIVSAEGEVPYAFAYVDSFTVHAMRLLVDKDDIEHSTTFWRVKT